MRAGSSGLISRLALALAAGLVAGAASAAPPVAVIFRQSDADIANPERGFYRPVAGLATLTRAEAAAAFADGYRLLYARIDLAPFRDRDLTPALLAALDDGFASARAGGVKLIVRAAYNYPRNETDYKAAQDAPLSRVVRHLDQLKPLLQRNADVIAFVQAGMVGAWGEWHTSSNNLTTPLARTRIKDALLAAVPGDRFVQFRYPPYITDWTPSLPPLAAALDGRFRIGFHNDCFLASATDVGTYRKAAPRRARQQQYMAMLGALAPFGGETCNPADDPGAEPRTGCAAILNDGARYRLSYLNAGYYRPLFHERWIADGCMADVRRRMGYRFALERLVIPASARRGEPLAMDLAVRNDGWARLYNPRPVTVVLQNARTTHQLVAIGTDPRTWLPGARTDETLRVTLPRSVAAGRYRVALALPDAHASVARDARFAVRFANADDPANNQRWNPAIGAFDTGATLVVTE